MSSQTHDIDVVDIVVEFLEVSIHHLLYLRNLYPRSIFVLRKMYNIPVQVSKHPALNEYINESLRTVRGLLRLQQLKCLSVCFYNEDEMPIERFVFDILDIQERYKISPSLTDPYLVKLREGFRAFCLKVSAAEMQPLGDNSSFQIHLLTTEQGSQALASNPAFEDFPWIELEAKEKELSSPHLAPIKTLESDFLKLQMYRELAST